MQHLCSIQGSRGFVFFVIKRKKETLPKYCSRGLGSVLITLVEVAGCALSGIGGRAVLICECVFHTQVDLRPCLNWDTHHGSRRKAWSSYGHPDHMSQLLSILYFPDQSFLGAGLCEVTDTSIEVLLGGGHAVLLHVSLALRSVPLVLVFSALGIPSLQGHLWNPRHTPSLLKVPPSQHISPTPAFYSFA